MQNDQSRLNRKKLLTIRQAADLLGISTKTLRRWEEKGVLIPQRTAGNQRRYSRDVIESFGKPKKNKVQPPLQQISLERPIDQLLFSEPYHPLTPAPFSAGSFAPVPPPAQKPSPQAGFELSKKQKIILSLGGFLLAGAVTLVSADKLLVNKENVSLISFAKHILGLPESQQTQITPVDSQGAVLGEQIGPLRLGVNIPAIFREHVEFLKNISIGQSATVAGTLTVSGITTLGDSVTARKDVTVTGALTGTSETLSGNLKLTGSQADTFILQPSSNPSSAVKLFTIKKSGATTESLASIDSSGNAIFATTQSNGTLKVTGASTLSGDVTAGGALTVSGATKISGDLTESGALKVSGASTLTGDVTAGGALTVSGTTKLSGALTVSGTSTFTGLGTFNGGITIPSGQVLTLSGTVTSNLIPTTTSTYDLGSSSLFWNNLYVNNVIGGSSGTQGFWQRNSGALAPTNISDDLLLGAISTSSAKFGFLNVAGGTPVASVSAGTAGATYLTAAGTLQTTANQTLTLGGSTTGTILLNPLNATGAVGINNNTPLTALDVTGSASLSANLSWRGSGTAHVEKILDNGTLNFQRSPSGDAGVTTVMYLANSGNIGLGTTAPLALLDVRGAASVSGQLTLTTTNTIESTKMNTLTLGSATTGSIAIAPAGTTAVYVQNGGNVGIGTSSPVGVLHVSGIAAGNAAAIFNNSGGTGDILTASSSGTPRFVIQNSGNVGLGTTLPTSELYVTRPMTFAATGKALGVFDQIESQDIFTASASGTSRFVIRNDGNVGIGTSSPATPLDVVGAINTSTVYKIGASTILQNTGTRNLFVGVTAGNTTLTGTDNLASGYGAGTALTSGGFNVFEGASAGAAFTTSSNNTAVGYQALSTATTATPNSAFGYQALKANTTGTNNTALGYQAGLAVTTGTGLTLIGDSAGVALTTSSSQVAIGYQALSTVTTAAAGYTAVGYQALKANTTGIWNTALGYQALTANTIGDDNTAVGYQALTANTSGGSNTAVGHQALQSTTTGGNNTAVGLYSLRSNTTGTPNSALGQGSLQANTTGGGNSAFGYQALNANTTASNNTAFGQQALLFNTTGANNTAVGYQALDVNTTASNNVAVGYQALEFNTTGTPNTGIGYQALNANTTGTNNTALGYQAGLAVTTGTFNTLLGDSAGVSVTTGANNTMLGYQAGNGTTTSNNNVFVGYQTGKATTGANNTYLGAQAGNANTTGNNSVGLGYQALKNDTTGFSNIAVGYQALLNSSGSNYNVAVGDTALTALTSGLENVAVGANALSATTTANGNTALGRSAGATNTTGTANIFLGDQADTPTATLSNQFIAGSSSYPINNVYFGKGVSNATPTSYTINGTGARGGTDTNTAGANLVLAGGIATGNAAGGNLIFQTSAAGSSGSSAQSLAEIMRITPGGNVGIGTTSPSSLLHVVGQCVTGDSLLTAEDGTRIRVDQVKPGMKVYTLDQQTGAFVPAQVNALMDMGVKPVFELTTRSGKQIRTTGNHPYLVNIKDQKSKIKNEESSEVEKNKTIIYDSPIPDAGWVKVTQLQVGDEIAVAPDSGLTRLGAAEGNVQQQENNQKQNKSSQDIQVDLSKVSHIRALSSSNHKSSTNGSDFQWVYPEEFEWDPIVSITYTGEEQVWDLAIEGTHNFVAGHYVNRKTGKALTMEQEEKYREYLATKKSAFADDLVNRTSSLNDWTDTLKSNIQQSDDFVNSQRGMDSPGVEPGRLGVSVQSSKPAEPMPQSLSDILGMGVNEEDIEYGGIVAHNTTIFASGGVFGTSLANNLKLSNSDSATANNGVNIEFDALRTGGQNTPVASISGIMTAIGSTTYTGALAFSTAGTAAIPTERLRIDSAGNVGIGTTNPSSFVLQVAGSVGPQTNNTYDLGSASLTWRNLYVNNIFGAGTGTQGFWTQQSGALYPGNATVDLLVGGTASTSAKFAVLNVNSGTPTASVSAGTAGAAFLTADGNLVTTARQTLTIGSSSSYNTTGNILIAPNGTGNVGIGTTNPGATLTVAAPSGINGIMLQNSSLSGQKAWEFEPQTTGTDTNMRLFEYATSGSNYRMTFRAGGNIGIGNITPVNTLDVNGTMAIGSYAATNTAPSNSLIVSGNVGVGNNSPVEKVDVTGNVKVTTGLFYNFTAGITQALLNSAGTDFATIQNDAADIWSLGHKTSSGTSLGTAVLSWTKGGNVGIGTTSPVGVLHVTGIAAGNAAAIFNNAGSTGDILTASSSGTPRFVIQNSGNVGLGTTLPTSELYVTRPMTFAATGKALGVFDQIESQDIFTASASGTSRFVIRNDGNVGIGTTLPNVQLHLALANGTPQVQVERFSNDINSAFYNFQKNRGTSVGTNANVAASDYLGAIQFQGYLNAAYQTGAWITSNVDSVASNILAANLQFSTRDTSNSFAARMTINNAGNVGIGNTSPLTALDVTGSASLSANLSLRGSGTAHTFNYLDNGTLNIQRSPGGDAGVTSVLFLANNGNIGVGSTTPGTTLDITGTLRASSTITFSTFSSNGGPLYTNGSGVLAQATAGTSSQCLLGGTIPSFGSCASGGIDVFWNQSSGALYPNNSTVDLLVGGQASTSAKFAVLNVNTGTPTASVSSGLNGTNGMYFTADGTLATLNRKTLTIGNSSTYNTSGNILIAPNGTGNVGIGTSTPGAALDVSGDAKISSTLTFGTSAAAAGSIRLPNNTAIQWRNAAGSADINGLTVDSSNNLVVGNTNATGAYYDVYNGGSHNFRMGGVTAFQVAAGAAPPGTGLQLAANAAGSGVTLTVTSTGTNESMSLMPKGSGNVGIGTTAPLALLDVRGAASASGQLTLTTTNTIESTKMNTLTLGSATTGDIAFAPAGTTRMYLQTGGNVGIGTASPLGLLHLESSSSFASILKSTTAANYAYTDYIANGVEFRVGREGTTGGGLLSGSSAGAGVLTVNDSNPMQFGTNNTIRMTIAAGGSVGIGTASPDYRLDVGTKVATQTTTSGLLGLIRNNAAADASPYTQARIIVYGGTNVDTNNWGYFAYGADASMREVYGKTGGGAPLLWGTSSALDGTGTFTPTMALTMGGNLGIGTTSPAGVLHVTGIAAGNAAAIFNNAGSTGDILTASASGSPKFTITNAGNVGIGTTLPGSKLDVNGAAAFNNVVTFTGSNFVNGPQISNQGDGLLIAGGATAGIRFNNQAQNVELVRIKNDGNVGIGTNAPLLKLDVWDSQSASAAAQIYNTNSGTDADGLIVKLGNTSTTAVASTNHFLSFETFGIGIVGSVQGSGAKGVTYATSGIADFAEYLPKDTNQPIEFGSVVCIDTEGKVYPCRGGAESIVGVASERPAFLGGENKGNDTIAVGLVGQVKTKVSTENGAIEPGDYLTSSSVPGVAMKATKPGQVVGKALESFDGTQETSAQGAGTNGTNASVSFGKILVFVNVSFADPNSILAKLSFDSQGNLVAPNLKTNQLILDPSVAFSSGNQPYGPVNQVATVSAELVQSVESRISTLESGIRNYESRIANLETTATSSSSLLNSYFMLHDSTFAASSSAELNLESLTVNSATVSGSLNVLGRTITTDLGVTGRITAGLLTVGGLEGTLNTIGTPLKLQSEGIEGVELVAGKVTIDTQGNLRVAQTLTAKKVETEELKLLGAKTIGSATLPAGQTYLDVDAPVASESSKIFVTATTLSAQALNVTQKQQGKFRVEVAVPTTTPVKFDWLVIQN